MQDQDQDQIMASGTEAGVREVGTPQRQDHMSIDEVELETCVLEPGVGCRRLLVKFLSATATGMLTGRFR